MDWNLYDTFINTNGSTPRDRKINELKNSLNKKLENSANCRTVKINNVDKKLMVLKTDLYNKKKIQTFPDQNVYMGDIVDFSGSKYLITTVDLDDEVYQVGEMFLCNCLIKWQKSDGTIITRYGFNDKYGQFMNNSKNMSQVVNPDLVLTVYLPLDKDTVLLEREKRFLIDIINENPDAYLLKNINRVSMDYNLGEATSVANLDTTNKLLHLSFAITQRSDRDNFTLMVADYFTPTTPITPTEEGTIVKSKITYTGESKIKAGGSTKEFKISYTDLDDESITNVITTWNLVVHDESLRKYYTLTQTVDGIKIKAALENSIVNTTIKLVASNNLDSSTNEIDIAVVNLING